MSEPPHESESDGWKAVVHEFVDARLGLIKLEAREAGREAARRTAIAVVIAGAALAAWALTLAGVIGWIARSAGWPWFFVALGAAVLHLLIAGIGALLLRQGSALFPLTRSELSKDREWLQTLKNEKSGN
ncbi:phage holin family protein [Haloferula sargassicola]|uniref:Phage holin family protein n=1 Tax=Haloferula sargassicola TaxID=490096 RepID=A0ABP9USS0_9BACT